MPKSLDLLCQPIADLILQYPNAAQLFAFLVVWGVFSKPIMTAIRDFETLMKRAISLVSPALTAVNEETASELKRYPRFRAVMCFVFALFAVFGVVYAAMVTTYVAATMVALKLAAIGILNNVILWVLLFVSVGAVVQMIVNASWFFRRGKEIWPGRS